MTIFKRVSTRSSLALCAIVVLALLTQGCGPGDAPADFFNFSLVEGTEVHLEITDISVPPETTASMRIRNALLREPGASALVGVALEDLHIHGDYTVTAPGGLDIDELNFSVAFKLTSPSARYGESVEYRASLRPAHDGHDDHDHDDDDHDHDDDDHDHDDDDHDHD